MGSGSPGAGNENPNVDFWRMLDATFEPVQAGNNGTMGGEEQEFGMLGAGAEGGGGWGAELPFEFGGGGSGFGSEGMSWP